MGIINKIKNEIFSNKRVESSIRRTYKITFEELASLLNTNDPITRVEINDDKKSITIETEHKRS